MQFIKNKFKTDLYWNYNKSVIILFLILGVVFLLNRIDFPSPKKDIEKIISNENFKIVK